MTTAVADVSRFGWGGADLRGLLSDDIVAESAAITPGNIPAAAPKFKEVEKCSECTDGKPCEKCEAAAIEEFRSEAQRRWMHANDPKMANRWEKETPDKDLPEYAEEAFCPTGDGGGVDNSCGGGSVLDNDPDLRSGVDKIHTRIKRAQKDLSDAISKGSKKLISRGKKELDWLYGELEIMAQNFDDQDPDPNGFTSTVGIPHGGYLGKYVAGESSDCGANRDGGGAEAKKKAGEAFCPTGDGGGIDNSCSSRDGGIGSGAAGSDGPDKSGQVSVVRKAEQHGVSDLFKDSPRFSREEIEKAEATLSEPKNNEQWEEFNEKIKSHPLYVQASEQLAAMASEVKGREGSHKALDVRSWSKERNTDDEGNYTPERAKLHEEIIGKMLNEKAVAPAGTRPKAVLLTGAPGCLHGDTPIHDPIDGTTVSVRDRHISGVDFHVWAMNESGNLVVALAKCPCEYPSSEMIKLTFSSGRSMTVTPQHRVWTGRRYSSVEQLLASGVSHLPSISECDLLGHRLNARRCLETALDDLGNYPASPLCDARPLPVEGIARSSLPLPSDARARNHCYSHADAVAGKQARNHPHRLACLPSSTDCTAPTARHPAVELKRPRPSESGESCANLCDTPFQVEQSASRLHKEQRHAIASLASMEPSESDLLEACTLESSSGAGRRDSWTRHVFGQSEIETFQQDVPDTQRSQAVSLTDSLGYRDCYHDSYSDRLVKSERVGSHPYFDFHVPRYENYWAVGFIHHNSGKTSAGQPLTSKIAAEFTVINADDVKAALPEYRGWNAGALHEESTEIAEGTLRDRAMDARHNILFDITGNNGDKMEKMANELVAEGYDVHVVSVTVPSHKSSYRAWKRFSANAFNWHDEKSEPGRFVPIDYVHKSVDGNPDRTYERLKKTGKLSSWSKVDNDVPRGTQPKIVDQGSRENRAVEAMSAPTVREAIRRFRIEYP